VIAEILRFRYSTILRAAVSRLQSVETFSVEDHFLIKELRNKWIFCLKNTSTSRFPSNIDFGKMRVNTAHRHC